MSAIESEKYCNLFAILSAIFSVVIHLKATEADFAYDDV